jgi:hypothetical protein
MIVVCGCVDVCRWLSRVAPAKISAAAVGAKASTLRVAYLKLRGPGVGESRRQGI